MTIQIWADVGGTFTDCLLCRDDHPSGSGERSITSLKVLSSSMVRGVITAVNRSDGRPTAIRIPLKSLGLGELSIRDVADRGASPPTSLPRDFFHGASLYRIESSGARTLLGTVRDWDPASGEITLLSTTTGPRAVPLAIGDAVELDCGIESPVLATRLMLGVALNRELPELTVRLGTTRGTNALLTRAGANTALLVTAGFGDLLEIGEQDREQLFDFTIEKRAQLAKRVIEINHRMDAAGRERRPLDEVDLIRHLRDAKADGIESLAICLMHSYLDDTIERRVESLAREVGFNEISRSSEVAPLIKIVSRAETTALDAYLNPILSLYVKKLTAQFGGDRCHLRLMTSSGNLVSPQSFRGRDSILSGPAGGVVALAHLAASADADHAIGLDMGGTSTDVSRYDGQVGRRYESRVAGIRVMTPMMDIHTVAAGGGSICDCVDGRLCVGPDSAGADPGPASYGRGGPLAVTDVNLLLGRLLPSRFPFPLSRDAAQQRLENVRQRLPQPMSDEALAEGFLDIAVTHMAEAAQSITTARGVDVRQATLVGFGGAAAQHLCRIANALHITRILDHPQSSVLSAVGMGLASIGRVVTRGVYRSLTEIDGDEIGEICKELRDEVAAQLATEKLGGVTIEFRWECDCRYVGTDAPLSLPLTKVNDGGCHPEELVSRFHQQHEGVFGYRRQRHGVQLVAIRCEATAGNDAAKRSSTPIQATSGQANSDEVTQVWHRGQWKSFTVLDRDALHPGMELAPASMVVSDQSTLIIEPDWSGKVLADGLIELTPTVVHGTEFQSAGLHSGKSPADDPVLLEVVARRLQGIADSMGEVLRRTAMSVNVKERLDFSCAVFRGDGALVANAAHVPVHLGAMGHTVRRILRVFPRMSPGDCFLSNDPFAGGSHLPDVTLVTPVFCSREPALETAPDFFVASRAHHAEIGGITPGSMPPSATCLAMEGILIQDFALVRSGQSYQDELRTLLSSGPYPSRNPEENLADISAQQAAGRSGYDALVRLAEEYSPDTITSLMSQLIHVAGDSVGRLIAQFPCRPLCFQDQLDDGTVVAVRLQRDNAKLTIDFDGTSGVHPGCLNATPSIVTAAVLYVMRCLCDSNLPLCDGVLRDIDLRIPVGLLNPPSNPDPNQCAAVVAGNVETSQRVVDVLLGAIGQISNHWAVAASQGTMNNLLLGDQSFGYYETIGGGSGATESGNGASGVHTHMTNTRITDPEILESRLPVRLLQFRLRRNSGGEGVHRGGDGLIREIEFLKPLSLTMITNRRKLAPYGAAGGGAGQAGCNVLIQNAHSTVMPPAFTVSVNPGDRLRVETPGGGGWGRADQE
ncbi:hydantoinase B/oxoprolinase family protein [Stieleria varia]|uniref:Acetophenone carboxylase gamma subunit n=1 Tax=Stieleria varia TaxID=2528005 RepID=A0A5C6B9Z4_9BACT|nr:hydantoinase B/oxoprolinase family protein [Stieleria varia]TWU08149.1 Acetophenone carboxylase gamma subunit [Stieleria varia]